MTLRAFLYPGVFTATGLPSIWGPSFLAPNLVGWWAADQGLTVNGSNQVTAWNDLSGAGNSLSNSTVADSLVLTANAQNSLPALSAPSSAPANGYWVQSAAAIAAMAFGLLNPFSLHMIIKRQATTGSQLPNETLISNNPSAAFAGWQLMIGSTYSNTVRFRITGASGFIDTHGSTALVNGNAYAITVTYDGSGSASGVQIYINGVAETMTVVTNTATGAVANGALEIGGWGTSPNNFRDADFFCEAVVVNAKLTSTQIGLLNSYSVQKWAA